MNNRKAQIKHHIIEFEKGTVSLGLTIQAIKKLTTQEIDAYSLQNYWRSSDLDEFVDFLSTEEITDWESINDERALLLIHEIFQSLAKDGIIHRNMTALEKRYKKSSGTISDWIFHEDISDKNVILEKLKIDS